MTALAWALKKATLGLSRRGMCVCLQTCVGMTVWVRCGRAWASRSMLGRAERAGFARRAWLVRNMRGPVAYCREYFSIRRRFVDAMGCVAKIASIRSNCTCLVPAKPLSLSIRAFMTWGFDWHGVSCIILTTQFRAQCCLMGVIFAK